MTDPSNANTSGLVEFGYRWRQPDWHPDDWELDMDPLAKDKLDDRVIEPLVTAASAQARIAELEAIISKTCDLSVEQTDKLLAMHDRATAAEARADRLAKALERIADRPGAGTTYTKGIGEQPVGEAEHMAEIARAAIQQEW